MCRRLLTVTLVWLWLSANPVYALFGVGDTVFDPTNFAKNTIMAAQMMEQVKQMTLQVQNSNTEVAMLLQNLMAVLGARYNYPLYAGLIREVMDTVQGGVPMHYNLPEIDAYQVDVYRGYTDATKWRGWEAN
jgi:conjugal transfer/entry exclusion protein